MKVRKFFSLTLASILLLAMFPLVATPVVRADDLDVVSISASEDAHTQMWSTQDANNYGGMWILKVCRPNADAADASNDSVYGRFGELSQPGDGNTVYLKFAGLTDDQLARVEKAELVLTHMGRRNAARSTSQNLIVRSVGNNWTEGDGAASATITAAAGSMISGSYARDAANGLYAVATEALGAPKEDGTGLLARSSPPFNPQSGGYSQNPSYNGHNSLNANAAVSGAKITTDITAIVKAAPKGENTLSLAVSADDDGCQQTFFVSKEGAAALNNAAADMAPTLRLTLGAPVVLEEKTFTVDLSDDAHVEGWNASSKSANYGSAVYMRVQRPNGTGAAVNDAVYGPFGELQLGDPVDGKTALLKFAFTDAQWADISAAAEVKAELGLTLFGRRYADRNGDDERLRVRAVTNDWTESSLSWNEMTDTSGGEAVFYPRTYSIGTETVTPGVIIEESQAFNPARTASDTTSLQASGTPASDATIDGRRIKTDISHAVKAMDMADASKELSLGISAKSARCQEILLLSKEGAASDSLGTIATGTDGADRAKLAPSLTITLKIPAAAEAKYRV
ncbi:MAG: hypothetical protein LBF64_04345, partial [Oscillospiraceae bacterium]|nr:hypothetical protein [Oscillospiraceae bacterium]